MGSIPVCCFAQSAHPFSSACCVSGVCPCAGKTYCFGSGGAHLPLSPRRAGASSKGVISTAVAAAVAAAGLPVFSRKWVTNADGSPKKFDEIVNEYPITTGPYKIGEVDAPRRIEFVRDRSSMAPFEPELAVYQRVTSGALRRGLIVYPGHGAIDGVKGDHISLYPPLIVSAEEIDEMLDILHATIGEVESSLGR